MKRISLAIVTVFLLVLTSQSFVSAQTATPQEILNQYISDLQKSPDDYALREKIIKHVQTLKPAPVIPEEARRHYVKACTLFEDAKQPSDSADAAEEFRQALLVAPWWGEAYMKMGLALETAQRYDDAIASLKLFMATNPQDEVLRKTQDEIYKIEAKTDKAAKDKELAAKKAVEEKQTQQEDAGAKKAKEQEEFLKKINGARYISTGDTEGDLTMDVLGDTVTQGFNSDRGWMQQGAPLKIEGRTFRCSQFTGVITDDGSTITIKGDHMGYWKVIVFKRER